jgi:hypothetical protein
MPQVGITVISPHTPSMIVGDSRDQLVLDDESHYLYDDTGRRKWVAGYDGLAIGRPPSQARPAGLPLGQRSPSRSLIPLAYLVMARADYLGRLVRLHCWWFCAIAQTVTPHSAWPSRVCKPSMRSGAQYQDVDWPHTKRLVDTMVRLDHLRVGSEADMPLGLEEPPGTRPLDSTTSFAHLRSY